jgi:hypothetical protein
MLTPEQAGMQAYRRRVLGALVDTADPYAQSSIDLDNQVLAPLGAASTYLGEGQYQAAVTAFQAAGAAGASAVGPEIDLVGAANVTQPITQRAWVINASLAAINNTATAALADAIAAQQFANQMAALYQTAIDAGQRALSKTPLGMVPGGPDAGYSAAQVLVGIAVAGTLLGIVIGKTKTPRARRPRTSRRKARR